MTFIMVRYYEAVDGTPENRMAEDAYIDPQKEESQTEYKTWYDSEYQTYGCTLKCINSHNRMQKQLHNG